MSVCLAFCLWYGAGAPQESSAAAARSVSVDAARLKELLFQRERPQEQSQAALLLLQARTAEAQAVVREGLRRHDRPDVFQALAAAARLWRDERHIPLLLQALSADSAPVRAAAIDSLAAQEPRAAARWLLGLAEDGSASLTARQAAVAVLGRCLHKSAVVALLKLLACDSPTVRQAAAGALQELSGQVLPPDALLWQTWWQPYKDLSDEEWLASRAALLADRSRRLAEELQRTESALIQSHQLLYGKVPPTDRVAHLQTLLASETPALRCQAVAWIGEALKEQEGSSQKPYVDLLLQLSRDGVERVQRDAVLALEKADDARAFDRLLQLLQLGSAGIRAAAARSLGRFGASKTSIGGDLKKRSILALEQALGDAALPVVASAAESLGMLQAVESGPLLVSLLKRPDEQVRQAAGQALEQVASLAVLEPLYLSLEDPSAQVRFSLIGALGRVAARERLADAHRANLLKRLAQALTQDSDPGVRSRAATVIGDLGSPADLPTLWQCMRTKEDNRVQLKAWAGMIEILVRAQSMPLAAQWEQQLTELGDSGRRTQLFQELRDRWLKHEGAAGLVEPATAGLVRALLAERKWQLAVPHAIELARKAQSESDKRERLRWLLVVGAQALDDKKPQEVLRLLKDIEELLVGAKELGGEFAELKRRALQMSGPDAEPNLQPAGLISK